MEVMSFPSVEIMWKPQKSCYVLVETMWCWEVLMRFDSEVAARVSGAAETVDYFG